MKKRTKKWGSLLLVALVVLASLALGDESLLNGLTALGMTRQSVRSLQALLGSSQASYEPAKKSDYYILDDKGPLFSQEDLKPGQDWQTFSPLDSLNRVGPANALIGPASKPREKRGDISKVYPTGWQQKKYDFVDGGALYNRCHLIAHQLTGENDNWLNLMTGTRSFNKYGMLPLENIVAAYIRDTGGQVRYRVTPVFKDQELLARGVIMEAASVDDGGKAVSFRAFVPNQEPGVALDYRTGRNHRDQ